MILQRAQVTEPLATPHTLELPFSGVCALVFGQMLALFEALVAVATFVRLLARVHSPMSIQVRRVLETFLALWALQWLFPRRVAAVLDEIRGGEEATVAERTLEGLVLAV